MTVSGLFRTLLLSLLLRQSQGPLALALEASPGEPLLREEVRAVNFVTH